MLTAAQRLKWCFPPKLPAYHTRATISWAEELGVSPPECFTFWLMRSAVLGSSNHLCFWLIHLSGWPWIYALFSFAPFCTFPAFPQLLAVSWPRSSPGSSSLLLPPPSLLHLRHCHTSRFPILLASHLSDEMRLMLVQVIQVYNCCS